MKNLNLETITEDRGKPTTCSEAGRIGGKTTLSRHGLEHFQKAGRKGQQVMASRYDYTYRIEWGKKGGRPKRTKFKLEGDK